MLNRSNQNTNKAETAIINKHSSAKLAESSTSFTYHVPEVDDCIIVRQEHGSRKRLHSVVKKTDQIL